MGGRIGNMKNKTLLGTLTLVFRKANKKGSWSKVSTKARYPTEMLSILSVLSQ